MATSRARLALALLTAGSLAAAALAQNRQAPESLLPPGFEEPLASPTAAPSANGGDPPGAVVQPLPGPVDGIAPTATPSPSPTAPDAAALAQYEMPLFARRPLTSIGPAAGVMPGGFGRADGVFLETLMRRLSAPLPSRWLSIALRRVLVSRLDAPVGVNGADFAAERAWLLLRMGESVAARALVQSVDTADTTPKLLQVAMQAALATGDPAALCPLTERALVRARDAAWRLAQPMCAALGGTPDRVRPLKADVRRTRAATGIDLQLAQKVIGASAGSRQAITIDWTPVTQLSAWRFGLAVATGVRVPDELYATVGAQVIGWRALAPAITAFDRAEVAERAAAMGVLSNLALVDLYAAVREGEDAPAGPSGVAADLQAAYIGADLATRLGALRQLWRTDATSADGYARLILTARAAARVRPGDGREEADRMVAAMLSAGLDRTAMRWRDVAPAGGDAAAMLLLADPDAVSRTPLATVSNLAGGGDPAVRRRLFFAGMAGLGRLSIDDTERGAAALGVPIGRQNPWTRALDRAVRGRQPATVVLLAAVGMQASGWRGVPPAALYRIVAALRAVGLEGEARMIAVEAMTRA